MDRPFATDEHTVHDAGFAPGSDQRIARSARVEQKLKARAILEATRNPISNPNLPQLPDEFVAAALAKLEIHIRYGNWEQARRTLEASEREWEANG